MQRAAGGFRPPAPVGRNRNPKDQRHAREHAHVIVQHRIRGRDQQHAVGGVAQQKRELLDQRAAAAAHREKAGLHGRAARDASIARVARYSLYCQ